MERAGAANRCRPDVQMRPWRGSARPPPGCGHGRVLRSGNGVSRQALSAPERCGTTFDSEAGSLLPFAVPILCVIPARSGSVRLPDKPLRLLAGEPLVRHVARRALEVPRLARVIVATDDRRVADAVAVIGVESVLTSRAHTSGTERVAAAARRYDAYDIVVNLQGDEPFIPAEAVDGAIDRVQSGDAIATAADPLAPGDGADPDRVKVGVDPTGRARWFSRDSAVPSRDHASVDVLHHVGVYAYRHESLLRWAALPPASEEKRMRLEQLRPLAHGMAIGVARVASRVPRGIDTPADLRRAETYLERLIEGAGR
jgi:3-deoxy-manno-octulosonate cytidylyltransferase (CMP-KDO synthetase)